jgi:hypothetical protein
MLCYERLGCQNCIVHLARKKNREYNGTSFKSRVEYNQNYNERIRRIAEVKLEVWQDWISKVPKDYHTLTEEEWQSVLEYFDYKCAFCQMQDFELRGMFLTVNQGGRYCNWNVIPVCSECVRRPKDKNPFRFMDRTATSNRSIAYKRRYSKKKLSKIIEYLEPILLVAANIGDMQKVQETSNESVN